MRSARISASLWTSFCFCSLSIMMRALPWRNKTWWRYLIWPAPMLIAVAVFTLVAFLRCEDLHCNNLLSDPVDVAILRKTIIEKRIATELQLQTNEATNGVTLIERQEAILRHAKQVIDSTPPAPTLDSLHDDGSLYRNISRFRRSYNVMEEVFRIYVYSDGHKPLIHDGPKTGIYASEGYFIELMETSTAYLTREPAEALMFFVPFSLKKMVDYMYTPPSRSMANIQEFIQSYVNSLAARYPYMNLTNGTNHFFVSCHDWALRAASLHQQLQHNAVKVVCNADRSRGFDTDKDVSLPETRILAKRDRSASLPIMGPNARPFLAFFAGQLHGKLRPVLLKHWKDKDPVMKIYGVLPASVARNTSYSEHMRLSKYCICAAGFEVNSPRLVEAIMNECVPVIVADNFLLPFSEVINWPSISIAVAEKDVPQLKQILTSIRHERYVAMQSRLKHVKRHFQWHEPPVKFDIFNMIIHSLWSQRLNKVDRFTQQKQQEESSADG